MKRLVKVETNAEDYIATYDAEEKTVRIFYDDADRIALEEIEDDSSWEEIANGVDNFDEWIGIDYNDPESPRIIEEKEFY